MRICLVHRNLHPVSRGGIGTFYTALAQRLRDARHTVALVTQDCDPSLDLTEVRTFTLPRTDDLPTYRRSVADLLRAWRPDVVDSATREAEILDYALRPRHERAATLVRGTLSARTTTADILTDSERDLVHVADMVCAVSDVAAAGFAHADDIPLPRIVAPGVDRALFRPGSVVAPLNGYRVRLDEHGDVAAGTPVLFPADLARDSDLLTASGGRPYRSTAQLAELLTGVPPDAAPISLTWDNATAAALELYYALAPRLAARS